MINFLVTICGVLRDLVPFVQFKKREKHPWRSVNFSKIAGYASHIVFKPYHIISYTSVAHL